MGVFGAFQARILHFLLFVFVFLKIWRCRGVCRDTWSHAGELCRRGLKACGEEARCYLEWTFCTWREFSKGCGLVARGKMALLGSFGKLRMSALRQARDERMERRRATGRSPLQVGCGWHRKRAGFKPAPTGGSCLAGECPHPNPLAERERGEEGGSGDEMWVWSGGYLSRLLAGKLRAGMRLHSKSDWPPFRRNP